MKIKKLKCSICGISEGETQKAVVTDFAYDTEKIIPDRILMLRSLELLTNFILGKMQEDNFALCSSCFLALYASSMAIVIETESQLNFERIANKVLKNKLKNKKGD